MSDINVTILDSAVIEATISGVPSDASWVPYDNATSGLTGDTVQEAIDETVAQLADKANKLTNILSLPLSYPLVVGDKFELFYRGLLRVNDPSNYHVNISCAKGYAYKRKFYFSPVADDVGTIPLTVSVIDDNGEVIETGTTNLEVIAAPAFTGKVPPADDGSHNLIDDSLIITRAWLNYVNGIVESTAFYATYCYTPNYIPVIPGQQYTCNGALAWYSYVWYDDTQTIISAHRYGNVITAPANAAFIRVCWNNRNTQLAELVFIKGSSTVSSYVNTYAEYVANLDLAVYTLNIGDSLTQAGVWVEELYRRLTGTGGTPIANAYLNINFVGTVGTAPCLYEGRGGWTYAHYSSSLSPFYIGGVIDIEAYAASLSIPQIDVFNILLGWNMTDRTETTFKNEVRQLVNYIRADYPLCKINLFGIQVGDADGMGLNYGATWNWFDSLKFVMNVNEWLEEVSLEYEDITFSQLSGQFDSEYNMPSASRAVNTRNITEEIYGTNGVHPAELGYLQIADAAYRKVIHTIEEFV